MIDWLIENRFPAPASAILLVTRIVAAVDSHPDPAKTNLSKHWQICDKLIISIKKLHKGIIVVVLMIIH